MHNVKSQKGAKRKSGQASLAEVEVLSTIIGTPFCQRGCPVSTSRLSLFLQVKQGAERKPHCNS